MLISVAPASRGRSRATAIRGARSRPSGELGGDELDRVPLRQLITGDPHGGERAVVPDGVDPPAGEPADQAGLRSGDLILSYADERVFDWSDVRGATTAGERGEMVPVTVQRARSGWVTGGSSSWRSMACL